MRSLRTQPGGQRPLSIIVLVCAAGLAVCAVILFLAGQWAPWLLLGMAGLLAAAVVNRDRLEEITDGLLGAAGARPPGTVEVTAAPHVACIYTQGGSVYLAVLSAGSNTMTPVRLRSADWTAEADRCLAAHGWARTDTWMMYDLGAGSGPAEVRVIAEAWAVPSPAGMYYQPEA